MKTEPIEIKGPHMRLAGQFRFMLNQGTPREQDSGWVDNMVLDQGLNYLGNDYVSDNVLWLSVGTGTNLAAASDTALQSFTASTNNRTSVSSGNLGASTYAGQFVFSWTFAQGAVVGNMAEVGVGRATGGGSLFSRARIVDGGGSATTLTVTSLDQLTVYYKLTCTPDLTDLTSSVVISGTTYNFTARLANASQYFTNASFELTSETDWGSLTSGSSFTSYPSTSTIGAITSTPSGTATNATNTSTRAKATYTNGNFYRDTTITVVPADCNSAGGIGAIKLLFGNSWGQWQYVFTAPIPKDNTKTLTLVVRASWSR